MIVSALLAPAPCWSAGLGLAQMFHCCWGWPIALVAAYIFLLVPEYLLRFIYLGGHAAWCTGCGLLQDEERIPVQGPAVTACNHVSYVDAVLLMAASREADPLPDGPPHLPACRCWAGCSDSPRRFRWRRRRARRLQGRLRSRRAGAAGGSTGHLPRGGLTADGTLQPFKPGVLKDRRRAPRRGSGGASVVLMALTICGARSSAASRRGRAEPP